MFHFYTNYLLIDNIYILILVSILFFYLARKHLSQMFFWYWVPLVETSDEKLKIFLDDLDLQKWKKIVDLWSWNGKVLEFIENKYLQKYGSKQGLKLYGIENSIYPYRESLERKEKNNLIYTVYKKKFFKENLSNYDIIYTFAIPYLLRKIWKKIKKECKVWTLFYSNAFKINWVKEYKKIHIDNKNFIYVYKV